MSWSMLVERKSRVRYLDLCLGKVVVFCLDECRVCPFVM